MAQGLADSPLASAAAKSAFINRWVQSSLELWKRQTHVVLSRYSLTLSAYHESIEYGRTPVPQVPEGEHRPDCGACACQHLHVITSTQPGAACLKVYDHHCVPPAGII